MTKNWTHALKFTIDPAAGEAHRETITLDGVAYEINVSPAAPLQQLRGAKRVLKDDTGFGKEAISLGPRGGGACACCGR